MASKKEELTILVRLQDFASKSLSRVGKSIANFGRSSVNAFKSVARQVFSLKGALVTAFGVGSLSALSTYAGEIVEVERSFGRLTESIGQDSGEILASLKRGFRGAVSESEALKQANTALLFGIADTPKEFEELATIARRLGAAVGKDAGESFGDLTTALARSSPLILDNLGISLKLTEAYKVQAEVLGKTVEELTDTEKSQAFLTAALEKGREVVSRLGPDVDTLQTQWGGLKAELRDLADIVLKSVAPAIGRGFSDIAKTLRESRPKILEFFAGLIEDAGKFVAEATKVFAGFDLTLGDLARPFLRIEEAILRVQTFNARNRAKSQQILVEALEKRERTVFPKSLQALEAQRKRIIDERNALIKVDNEFSRLATALERVENSLSSGKVSAVNRSRGIANEIESAAKEAADNLRESARGARLELEVDLVAGPTEDVFRDFQRQIAEEQAEVQAKLSAQPQAGFLSGFFDSARQGFREVGATSRNFVEELTIAYGVFGNKAAESIQRVVDRARELRAVQEEIERTTFLGGLTAGARELESQIKGVGEITSEVLVTGVGAFSSGITDAFLDAATGARTAKEAFSEFAVSFLRQIAQLITQQLIFNAIAGAFGGGGGGGGGGAVTQSVAGSIASGFTGIPTFGDGGVVTKRTLAIVGDKGPERIIPERDFQRMGGQVSMTINFNDLQVRDDRDIELIKRVSREAVAEAYERSFSFRNRLSDRSR